MKSNKLTATVSAILSLCFPLCACTDLVDPIEYTAEKPIYEYVPEDFKWRGDSYDELKNYYVENNRGSKLFLFDLCENEFIGPPPAYCVCEDSESIYICESFYWRDEELGIPPENKFIWGNYDGGIPPYSFSGEIVITPLKAELNKGELTFEFGNVGSTQKHRAYKYANIFANGECFATFSYIPKVAITQEWFENFLTENLVWGDSLEYEETEDEI